MKLYQNELGEITVPTECIQKAELQARPALDFHAGQKAALLLPQQMTATELLQAIQFCHDMAVNLSMILSDAGGDCTHCGRCGENLATTAPPGSALRMILDFFLMSKTCVARLEQLLQDNIPVYDTTVAGAVEA